MPHLSFASLRPLAFVHVLNQFLETSFLPTSLSPISPQDFQLVVFWGGKLLISKANPEFHGHVSVKTAIAE